MTSCPAPTPEEQVLFLRNFQRLLSEGSFVASYKFALLRALADLALIQGDDTGDTLSLTTAQIAEQFIRVYWRQSAPFPGAEGDLVVLKQNTGKQAAVVNAVAAARHEAGESLAQLQQEGSAWRGLVGRVKRTVEVMPLWKLQTVGSDQLEFLYPNVGSGNAIVLKPGVAYCLRAYYALLMDLVQAAWLRYVRQVNAKVLGQGVDLAGFLFGAERSNLDAARSILTDAQSRECFYCRRDVRTTGHVDHFIPWARYPMDLGANFVLAHAECNGAKSDHIAAEPHLERWTELLRDRGPELEERFVDRGLGYELEASRRIARWAYRQVADSEGQVWRAGPELVRLTGEWKHLLDAG